MAARGGLFYPQLGTVKRCGPLREGVKPCGANVSSSAIGEKNFSGGGGVYCTVILFMFHKQLTHVKKNLKQSCIHFIFHIKVFTA